MPDRDGNTTPLEIPLRAPEVFTVGNASHTRPPPPPRPSFLANVRAHWMALTFIATLLGAGFYAGFLLVTKVSFKSDLQAHEAKESAHPEDSARLDAIERLVEVLVVRMTAMEKRQDVSDARDVRMEQKVDRIADRLRVPISDDERASVPPAPLKPFPMTP